MSVPRTSWLQLTDPHPPNTWDANQGAPRGSYRSEINMSGGSQQDKASQDGISSQLTKFNTISTEISIVFLEVYPNDSTVYSEELNT